MNGSLETLDALGSGATAIIAFAVRVYVCMYSCLRVVVCGCEAYAYARTVAAARHNVLDAAAVTREVTNRAAIRMRTREQ